MEEICRSLGLTRIAPLPGVKRVGAAKAQAAAYKRPSKKMRKYLESTKIDRKLLRELVTKGLPYKTIAAQLGCCDKSVSIIAKGMGFSPHARKSLSDKELHAYLKKHPDADLATMSKAVGYKGPGALRARLIRFGVHLKTRKDYVPGGLKIFSREKLRELLEKGTTYRLAAQEMGCSATTVQRIASRELNVKRLVVPLSQDVLLAYLKKHPDAARRCPRQLGTKAPWRCERGFIGWGSSSGCVNVCQFLSTVRS
jgi:DNA invertase Pin-like site-specific DNA recombinase